MSQRIIFCYETRAQKMCCLKFVGFFLTNITVDIYQQLNQKTSIICQNLQFQMSAVAAKEIILFEVYEEQLEQFQQQRMNKQGQQFASSSSSSASNLAEKQYKLYDIELFKSQLKIFQKAQQPIEPSNSHEDLLYDNCHSNSRLLELPFTHQDIKSNNSKTEIDVSVTIDPNTIDNPQKIQDNKIINQEETKPIEQVKYKVLTIEADQKQKQQQKSGVINPLFLPKQSPTSSELVRQLQILSLERSKCRQSSYFTKKERTVQVKNMQELFQKYKSNHPQQKQKYSAEENKSIQTQNFKNESSFHNHQKSSIRYSPNLNDCQLCVRTSQKVQRHRQKKSIAATPQVDKTGDYQKWLVGSQQRVKKVNYSPAKPSQQKYLVSEDKNLYQSQHSKFIFESQVPLKEEYIVPNKLRDQYLKDAQMRSTEIHKQIEKLKSNEDKISSNRSSSRKKIFITPSILKKNPSINVDKQLLIEKEFETPKTAKNSRNVDLSPYKNIFSSKVEKDIVSTPTKKQNGSVDFKYVRQTLTNTRIHIFNTKLQQKSTEKSKSKSKIFKRSPKKASSPPKREIIHNFNLIDLTSQNHEWFRKHQRQIISQSQKIHSYQLITRYISTSQIQVRLNQFVKGMIEPKRWILLLVDSVYARLKDRYLPA